MLQRFCNDGIVQSMNMFTLKDSIKLLRHGQNCPVEHIRYQGRTELPKAARCALDDTVCGVLLQSQKQEH